MALLLAASACKVTESTKPLVPPVMYHISATISGSNTCVVNAPGNVVYSSTNNITGDVPRKFVSTYDKNYHGFSCWVSVVGGMS